MGVGASMTISLMKDQKLWGLIACHHRTPKYVPYELRKACEFLGRMIFAEIFTREEEADYNYRMFRGYRSCGSS
jgi:chemotaxis family two-component system sensor kinase Cph1